MATRRDIILVTVDDLAGDFTYYDRKDAEGLPLGEIQKAIAAGEVTRAEIVARFAYALYAALPD